MGTVRIGTELGAGDGVGCVGCFWRVRAEAPTERQVRLIDAGWRFAIGDRPGAEAAGFDDAGWERVGLPHSFGLPYFGSAKFYVGYGWYRKHLRVDGPLGNLKGRREYLEFEAAFQDAEVWVNGKPVGSHQGGYTGFSLDATGAIKTGDNIIAVRVDNVWNARLNPRGGEHNFNGGIYRNVYLVTTDEVHVTWYGTSVTTPGLSAAGSPVHVETELRNDNRVARRFTLRTDVVDAVDRQVATATTEGSVAAGSMLTVEQTTGFVAKPALWSPAHPAMYRAVTHVTVGGREVDRYETPFGFRWIKWTAEEGFFLNGEHDYFHGADVHQDHAGWGDGVTNAGIRRDVRLVKGAGMDFIRGSHYPHSPVFADECDRQGLLFWEENSFWGTGGAKAEGGWTASAYPPNEADQAPFEANVEQSLAEMVRINRNHPSIVAWSMGNEMFFSNADLLPKIRVFLKKLVDETHGLDPTRPAAVGGVQRGEIDKIGDVAGYNGDGAKEVEFLDPGVANVVTEYGSTMTDRPGKYQPGWGDLAGQPQFKWRSGQALWCAFDYGSIFTGMGTMGMIDYFRLPKRMWFWYRNEYLKMPPPEWPAAGKAVSLGLTADDDGRLQADGTGDVQVIVTVRGMDGQPVSGAPPVKLEIVSGPGEFPTGRAIDFAPDSDIAIRDGQAAMELRAYQSGTIRLKASSPGLTDAELTVQAAGGPAFLPGVTPLVAERRYVKPADSGPALDVPVDLSLNRPTDSSSSAAGHGSRLADDGNQATFWEPRASEPAWWQLDLEARCQLGKVRIAFAGAGPTHYEIEVSDDGAIWRTVVEHQSGDAEIALPEATTGRFVRMVFESAVIRLAEVKVLGHPL